MNFGGWLSLTVRLTVALAIGLVLGLILGVPWAAIALVLAICLSLQWLHLLRLLHWLKATKTARPPELPGPWGHLGAMIVRIYRRKQFPKQRLLLLLRELRSSTAAMPYGVVVLNP